MKRSTHLLLSLVSALLTTQSFAQVALIYKGPGSCSTEEGDAGESGLGCSDITATIAKRAGFKVRFVRPTDLNAGSTDRSRKLLFKDARIWIQPGGKWDEVNREMTPELISTLKKFISDGGGYVGFCAGAVLAADHSENADAKGLGIFPGSTPWWNHYIRGGSFSLEPISWAGKNRIIYFEGGPYLSSIDSNSRVEKVAYYSDGSVAAARNAYGKGRVFIAGPHPEAPAVWSEEDGVKDPDGLDHDLVIGMLKWAAAKKPVYFAGRAIKPRNLRVHPQH